MIVFCIIVITLVLRSTPSNKLIECSNQETNRIMWERCVVFIMDLEQLIFGWKG